MPTNWKREEAETNGEQTERRPAGKRRKTYCVLSHRVRPFFKTSRYFQKKSSLKTLAYAQDGNAVTEKNLNGHEYRLRQEVEVRCSFPHCRQDFGALVNNFFADATLVPNLFTRDISPYPKNKCAHTHTHKHRTQVVPSYNPRSGTAPAPLPGTFTSCGLLALNFQGTSPHPLEDTLFLPSLYYALLFPYRFYTYRRWSPAAACHAGHKKLRSTSTFIGRTPDPQL